MNAGLQGKKIILAVSGSIAAYKAAVLTRLLVKAGVKVQVIMTPAAAQFITPLTLSTLSKAPVLGEIQSENGWNNHVELGLWADAMLVAPATANTLAKLASGICDNLLTAVYLSARCPVFLAPAMDVDMWHHPATRANVEKLKTFGNTFIPVGHGELASGLVGEGRMAEPESILSFLENHFLENAALKDTNVLVTAGPTYEPIDPVRFIGNRSSGKMGIAVAEALARRGAAVQLILGPTHLRPEHPAIQLHLVQTAQEMFESAIQLFPSCKAAVLSAAVADYRPRQVADQKIKKSDAALQVELESTRDIAATLGQMKQPGQILLGFALETENAEANAQGKLLRKNLDAIVLNSLREPGAGFGHDTNKISILYPGNKKQDFQLKAKTAVAEDIVDALVQLIHA